MKVLFVQLWYDFFGGIETVNDTLASQFSDDGCTTTILCLWKTGKNEIINSYNYKKEYINEEHKRVSIRHTINHLKSLKFKHFFKDVKKMFENKYLIAKDYKNLAKKIRTENPDHIIVSSYQMLKLIPKEYLKKSVVHMHTDVKYYTNSNKIMKCLKKYNDKINRYIWLTPSFMNAAIKLGLTNSTYMYNPVRIKNNKVNLLNHKNVIFIGRMAPEKRIDRLIAIFNNFKITDWNLLIYGSGDESNLEVADNIKFMGATNDVKQALLNASVLVLTSEREGFPMVILEAYECGVPVITFNFGLSTHDIIKDGETGYIINQNDEEKYLEKLEYLCRSASVRKKMGSSAKQFAKQFHVNNVVKRWYELFKGEI